VIFDEMQLWLDPVRRSGPEVMAVDECLLEMAEIPVLRVYRWAGEWASVGYFGQIQAARAAFPGVNLVRRWTGGGMVDHRSDWTYSLIIPQGEPLASLRGAESYRQIHASLAEALVAEGIKAWLSRGEEETGAALCFENPVSHDLLGAGGRKLAGAGQKRSRIGLLHQGSVASFCEDELSFRRRAAVFSEKIAKRCNEVTFEFQPVELIRKAEARYSRMEWTCRR
jgi:lipoyl(octanoyl) transferase